MAGVLANEGTTDMLSAYLAGGTPPTLKLRLYSNNHTPVIGDTVSAYTEVTAAGYAAITLSPGSWVVSTVSGHVVAAYPAQVFLMTAAFTAYGYYITDSGGTRLEGAELASGGPFTFGAGGGGVYVQLNINGP
jgi:hypothetical protein